MARATLHIVFRPQALPAPPRAGRVAVLDLAFALGADYETSTRAYVAGLGQRLAVWIDHHDHPQWSAYANDARFVLVSKLQARACPQLVTPERVAAAGVVQHVVAHGDFDGCMAAAKFLRGGTAPYPEADEDARHADAPGQGFACSPRGARLLRAFEGAGARLNARNLGAFLQEVVASWVQGEEPPALRARLDLWAAEAEARALHLDAALTAAVAPCAGVLLLDVGPGVTHHDKKYLLRRLEERARVAIVRQGRALTLATFDDTDAGLDLGALPGVMGQRGYAWGNARLEALLPALLRALRG